MKKIYILTAVFALLTLSLNAQLKADQYGNVVQPNAQTGKVNAPNRAIITGSVTAADGTSTSTGYQWLPVYGYYFESAQTTQMIYRAAQLDGLQSGDKITSLTFYPNGNIAFSGGSITLSLGNTSTSQFSSNSALSVSMTQVARVTSYPVSNGAWTITFTTPFTYTGENILVQVNTTSGNYGRTYFYGQDQSNYQSRNSYGSTNRFYFLPKVTLNYERSTDPEITASTTSVNFKCQPGETLNQTVTVNGLNLTGNISATISGTDASLFSVNPSSLGTSGGSLSVTYSPTAVGTHSATLTLSSTGAQDVTITLNGSCVQEQTICDGSTTSSYLPVYGTWYDATSGQHNQMIYPANLLSNLNGKDITSMTFYAPNGIQFSGGSVTFSIGTTSTNAFSSATALTDPVTAVATVVPQGETEWVIIFSDPYPYNGGNLLIQVDTETGTYAGTAFTGMEMGANLGYYSYNSSNSTQTVLPKVTFGYEVSGPKIVVSPETLTINDSGTNNTFTVVGTNLGTDNVGLTQSGSNFVPSLTATTGTHYDGGTYWGFTPANGSVNGTVAMNYNGRDLSASETVSLGNNTGASATVTVNYRADLYIVGDFGNGWDFSTGTQMTYNSDDNTYTATVTVDDGNYILFARKLGESNPWGTRLIFGPSSNGNWVLNGDEGEGSLNLYDNRPIEIVNGGTYIVTINATNNTFTIEKQVLPPPENVEAVADSEHQTATVTWEAPSDLPILPGPTTEGFDDTSVFEPFSLGDITATNHIGAIGGWTLYDPTGARVWGVDGGSFPNMSEPHAWMVMNPTNEQASGVDIMPNSPAQYMESICPLNNSSYTGGAADHWLISPELSGDAQTITFYERIITTGYDPGYETYEILVSSNDINSLDPSSGFTALQTVNSTALEWTLRSFDLPEGTKHFAIRHISNDVFGMMIDDVTYEGAVPNYAPTAPVSYNVYLDGVLVGNVPANDPLTYDFSNLAVGEHTVEISAVYPGDIESEKVADTFTIIGRTATPTITVVTNADGSKTISATGDGTVHLYVDGNEVTNPYTIPASPDGDKTYTVTATAQEEGKLVSEPAEEIVTVAEGGRTPMPVITIVEHNGYVEITATGDGTVTLTVEGQTVTSETGTGSATIIIVKSNEEQELSITATAQDGDLVESRPANEEYTVPALNTTPTNPASGLLRLHLLIVDQMKEEIPADNSHPDRYNYVLRYEPNGPQGEGVKESGTVKVDIQKADCEVTGYYSLKQIDGDTIIGLDHKQGITMDVVTADVAYDLSDSNDLLYEYLLQGAKNRDPLYQQDYLTKLRKSQNFTYFEMLDGPDKGTEYPNGEHHYLGEIETGTWGSTFMSYAPSVSTWGIQRRYYEDDGYDNTYGAPIWRSAVGEVKMSEEEAPIAERQTNQWNSVNWTDKDAQGNDAPASLFILDNIWATAKLPHTQIATVKYEPYMFRVFVQSNNGLLRPYKVVPQGEGQYDGEHLDAVDRDLTEADVKGPKCVWSGYLQFDEDGEVIGDLPNGVEVQPGTDDGGQKTFTYHKSKVDRQGGSNATLPQPSEWDKDPNNAMFGALDALAISGYDAQGKPILRNDITEDDLKIFVRFYYVVKGMADGWTPGTRGQGDDPAGYGSESGSSSPGIATSVNEIRYHGEAVETIYYNVQGMSSDRPFEGVNIVVTRYSDGATVVSKVVK